MDVTIDKEFAALCPPLTIEELNFLEASVIEEGCREPLTVWQENGKPLVLDGHNRLAICKRFRKDFKTRSIKMASRDEARNWIIANQLGRRNLTEDQKSYLRGKRYNSEKREHGGKFTKGNTVAQNGPPSEEDSYHGATAAKLGKEYGVGYNTIKRDAKFATAVDAIAASSGEQTRRDILGGSLKVTKQDVVKLAALPADKQQAAVKGGADAIKKAVTPKRKRNREGVTISALAVRATLATLDQLVRNLETIGAATRAARHVDAIRKEVENVRNSNP